jgi:hypothetical protein
MKMIPGPDKDELADRTYDHQYSHTGVRLGISETLETCGRCGQPFVHVGGAEEPPKHVNTGKPCCPDCIGKDCVFCGRHKPGQMKPIPGTPYVRCSDCSPRGPDTNQPNIGVIGAQTRLLDRG